MLLIWPAMAGVLAGPRTSWGYPVAAVLFLGAAVTDLVDGRLARRWEATTTGGAFLDTTADKLLTAGLLIALVAVDRTSAWIAAIIVGRELAILGLRGVVATHGQVIDPSRWGKLKTNAQFVAILLAIVRPGPEFGGLFADEWVMLAAVVITVWSGIEYVTRFARLLRSAPSET